MFSVFRKGIGSPEGRTVLKGARQCPRLKVMKKAEYGDGALAAPVLASRSCAVRLRHDFNMVFMRFVDTVPEENKGVCR